MICGGCGRKVLVTKETSWRGEIIKDGKTVRQITLGRCCFDRYGEVRGRAA